jgi:hypothetical protein
LWKYFRGAGHKASYAESVDRFKAYAWDQTNNKYAVMYDHQDDDDEALTYGSKTALAFDLSVKLYGSSSGSYRRFTGNVSESSFTMQDIQGGTKLALAGYAKGEGKHFLAKSGSNYYCFAISSQENYTTSGGKVVTVITGLSLTEPGTCDNTACGGCEADNVTIGGELKTLPEAVDLLVLDLNVAYVPSKHFQHEFELL